MISVILFLGFIALLLWVQQHSQRLKDLEDRLFWLDKHLESLAKELGEWRGTSKTPAQAAAVQTAPQEQPAAMKPVVPVMPPPQAEMPPVVAVPVKPPPMETLPGEEPSVAEIPAPAPPPPVIEPPPIPSAQTAAPEQPPAKTHAAPAPVLPAFDWESLVGVKLFSWIAGVALLLAAVFFLRYAVGKGWMDPPVRMAIGLLVGIGLLVLCELRAARRYPVTANAMDASAVAILFSTFFAAHALWGLIGAGPAFIFMVLVTVLAVVLSVRRDSVFIALLGLVGGFATPALLSSGENRPVTLFTYLLLLNAGLAWVALKKGWTALSALSFVFTLLYQWSWVIRFLTASQLPLALGIFLAFPILAFAVPAISRKQEPEKSGISLYGQTANWSALFPLIFALYMAAVPAYGRHFGMLFGFLFLLDAGLFAIAAARGPEALHLLGGVSTILVWALWLAVSYESSAWPSVQVFVALFAFFYMASPLIARHFDRGFKGVGRYGVYAASLLLFVFPFLIAMERRCAEPGLVFGTLFLILLGTSACVLIFEQNAVYYIAAIFAILAEAVWSVNYLRPGRLYSGLVLYAVFGLFFIAVPMAARRWRDALRPLNSGAASQSSQDSMAHSVFLGLTAHLFLIAVAGLNSLSVPPWPFLTVLLILDLGMGAAALYLRRNDIHLASMAASGLILMVWVAAARTVPWPRTAVLLAGALVLFAFAWIRLARRAGIGTAAFAQTAGVTCLLAQCIAVIAGAQSGSPGVLFLLGAHLVFLAAVMGLEWSRKSYLFTAFALIPATVAVSAWYLYHSGREFWSDQLVFSVPIYLAFVVYPLLLGRRSGRSIVPYLTAVLAGIPFFFQARHSMIQAGWGGAIGILPLTQALLMALLLLRLLRIEPPGERSPGRLALVAGAALAFVTLAIPLQLEKEWITIGWALEGAALAWLFGKVPHRGLLYFSSALFAAVFARLALNPFVLVYRPRGGPRIWNWYLYTYFVSAVAMFVGGWFFSKTKDSLMPPLLRASRLLSAGGVILLFLLLNIEIADFYSTGRTVTFNFSATLAQDLTYTLGWALFAVALLAAGIVLRSQAARIASLGLLVVTIFKCFIHDLGRLGGLYRIASFVGLAVCLALVALALQKFVLSSRGESG